jgi:hypothetical protein
MSQVTHGKIDANASNACFLVLFCYIQQMDLTDHNLLGFRHAWSSKQEHPDRNDIALPATFAIFQPHELLC